MHRQGDRFADPEPNLLQSARIAHVCVNCHLVIVMSIPPSIHDLHLKYLEINDFLFSQQKQIRTCLQQLLKRFSSVPNSLQISPRKPLLTSPPLPVPLSNLENVWAAQHFLLSSDIADIESFATFAPSF
jgi:hypothetical protein